MMSSLLKALPNPQEFPNRDSWTFRSNARNSIFPFDTQHDANSGA
jgi:hypothetical protein